MPFGIRRSDFEWYPGNISEDRDRVLDASIIGRDIESVYKEEQGSVLNSDP